MKLFLLLTVSFISISAYAVRPNLIALSQSLACTCKEIACCRVAQIKKILEKENVHCICDSHKAIRCYRPCIYNDTKLYALDTALRIAQRACRLQQEKNQTH